MGGSSILRRRIISYLKDYNMISNGFLYHSVRVNDLDSDVPPIKLVPVMIEFL